MEPAAAAAAAAEEKVFVAVPAEPGAGQSTLLWALGHLYSSRATTVVLTHVHVPPQMVPISCGGEAPCQSDGRGPGARVQEGGA